GYVGPGGGWGGLDDARVVDLRPEEGLLRRVDDLEAALGVRDAGIDVVRVRGPQGDELPTALALHARARAHVMRCAGVPTASGGRVRERASHDQHGEAA